VLEHDWVSAFGQATVLIGLLQLELCWPGSTRFEEYAAAFEVTAGDGMWFSRHLSRGGVWFEEVALDERPTQIMNGHVYSMLALYYLWNETADDRWLVLFEQANLGPKRYVSEFRRPGETNCYDRIDPCLPDYGPERTVFLMDALFEITDEEAWRVMRDLFASDMGFDGSTFGSVQGPGS
jgi:hypothetical protein